MGSDMYVALSGALARMRELDVAANNLANVDTVGYKRDRTSFVTALETALSSADGKLTPGAAAQVYAAVGSDQFDSRGGPIETTGGSLDVAIDGSGYFAVQTDRGTRYTRAGAFSVNAEGQLTTASGEPVLGGGSPIGLPAGPVEITASGAILLQGLQAGDPLQNVGQLSLVEFAEDALLTKEGRNLFRAPEDVVPIEAESPQFVPRSLERSNVQPVQELADLVILQRSFDIALRMLESDNEASTRLIQEMSS